MEHIVIPGTGKKAARLAIGTWVLGGLFSGCKDEKEFIRILHRAFDSGINLIDTAPLYGLGKTEELVGKALKQYGHKDQIILATKFGLSVKEKKIYRDARKEIVRKEIEDSLRNLQVDCVDLYQLHWPDLSTPFSETAEVLAQLKKEGKIKSVGLSNCTREELENFEQYLPVQAVQIAYNFFERDLEKDLLAYCHKKGIAVLGYGPLCRGILSGEMQRGESFVEGDLRGFDPKFKEPRYSKYLRCVDLLQKWALEKYCCPLPILAIRWTLEKGVISLWGPRTAVQLISPKQLQGWKIKEEDLREIDAIIASQIQDPIGIEFLAPSCR